MIVHISLFYLKDAKDTDALVAALNRVPQENPAIVTSQVGANMTFLPAMPGLPKFAHVAQVITFANQEDADSYAASFAHQHLREETDDLIDWVAGADFAQP